MKLDEFSESMTCSECGGPAFSDLLLAEKKDACYNKVRSRYKVWPSAYASGALVQCRKKGAANWGNKSKNESLAEFAPTDSGDGGNDGDEDDAMEAQFTVIIAGKPQTGTVRVFPGTTTDVEYYLNGKIYIKNDMQNVDDYDDFIENAAGYIQEIVQLKGDGHHFVEQDVAEDANFRAPATMMKGSPQAVSQAQGIIQQQADKNIIGQAKIAGAIPSQGVAEVKGELWRVLEPRNIGGHAARYYVVKGQGKDLKIWRSKSGAGDFIKQADAEAKASELNQGVAEEQLDEKCWDTHRQEGMKKKGDRMVPNCVPKESIEENSMDLNKLRDAAKTAKPASKLDKDKKQPPKKGAMDLATLRAAAKTAKPASELDEDYNPEYDDEAGMADNNLETLKRAVEGIDDLIQTGDNLPEWCQEKIANAKSMLVAVWDYMYSEEASDEVDPEIDAMFEAIDGMAQALARKYNISLDEAWESFEALPDHVLYETAQFRLSVLNEDWQKVNKQDRTDGMSRKAVKAYRRENPGSKLKTAVTTKPSKLKKGGKAAKRRKSFCARMRGMKKSRASAKTKRNPNSPINKALRRWNC